MTYFPKYNGNSASISDALSAVGANGSYQSRQQIAAANGIRNYTGTAAQNTQMLNMLKAGNLINPSGTSTSASSSNDGRTTTTYVISDDGSVSVETTTTRPGTETDGNAAIDVTQPMGMNKWLKYGLIAGGVAVAGLLIYKLTKKKKKAVEQRPAKRGKLSGNHAKAMTISEFSKTRKKTGDKYFRLVDKKGNVGKTVYFINFYERSERKYSISKFEDVNSERFISPKQLVTTDFEF